MKTLLLFIAVFAGYPRTTSLEQITKKLQGIYADHRVTFFSGCAYQENMEVGQGCRAAKASQQQVGWEYLVPVETYGKKLKAWTHGNPACKDENGRPYRGQACAAKVNNDFRRMESDLYNIVPEILEVKQLHRNYAIGAVPDGSFIFSSAQMKLGDNQIEPADRIKGDVARIYLYMDATYPDAKILYPALKETMLKWSELDPVDAWECEKARRIAKTQGNENAFIEGPCAALRG